MSDAVERIRNALTMDKGTFVERVHTDGMSALEELVAERDLLERRLSYAITALDLVDLPYPIVVFPERSDERRDAIFAAMRAVDKYATEWFYAHVARERGRVAREAIQAAEREAAE